MAKSSPVQKISYAGALPKEMECSPLKVWAAHRDFLQEDSMKWGEKSGEA